MEIYIDTDSGQDGQVKNLSKIAHLPGKSAVYLDQETKAMGLFDNLLYFEKAES
jgi:hypothetical protein